MTTLSVRTVASLAQVLGSLTSSASDVLVQKYLGFSVQEEFGGGQSALLEALLLSEPSTVLEIVGEFAREPDAIRADAPTKYVFDGRYRELLRWLLHDGWQVADGSVVRVTPAAEEVTGTRDELLEELARSTIDEDEAIRRCIEDSSTSFTADPPDFNDAITKVRIALETIGRRAASTLSARDQADYPEDSWGRALAFLRARGHIDQTEEDILARVYTFISRGTHIPVGITLEEWARLARTFGLSSCYFLLKKYETARAEGRTT